jgi:hypothetical protein
MNVARINQWKIKQWKATRGALERARAALPPPISAARVPFEVAVAGFHHFISHNELELALDELCVAAELVESRASVWWHLERAARLMKLYPRAAALRRTFWAAAAQERSAGARMPARNGHDR